MYNFRYRLHVAPEARLDGSGQVAHDIFAEVERNGEGWTTVPGRHKSVMVPASELQAALAAGNNAAIVAAYKTALASNIDTVPFPVSGWGIGDLEALMTANDAATDAATAADEFITVTLGLPYPVTFAI